MSSLPLNQIICADVREGLAGLPDESVQCCVTSPPYWGLRDYGLEPVVCGGDGCAHEWSSEGYVRERGNVDPDTRTITGSKEYYGEDSAGKIGRTTGQFCLHCGAWRGSLGLEPTPELYVEHLVQIFREVRRVLRKDGTVWLNLGSSYASSSMSASLSRPAWHEQPCGNGDKAQSDLQGTGSSCRHSDDEYPGDFQNHHGRTSHNVLSHRGDGEPPCMRARDNEHPGLAEASPGALLRGAQESTTPESSYRHPGAYDPEARVSACQSGHQIDAGSARASSHTGQSRHGKFSRDGFSASHKQDKEPFSRASQTASIGLDNDNGIIALANPDEKVDINVCAQYLWLSMAQR